MADSNSKDPVTLRLSRADKDLLDAIVYIETKITGSTKSPNDVLGPVVAEYLRQHANDPGVQLGVQAAEEARRAASRRGRGAGTEAPD